ALGSLVPQAQLQGQNHNPGSLVFNLVVSDVDADPVTVSARAAAFNQPAYNLQHQYGLFFTGNYQTGVWGANEKWLRGRDGDWYCILPDGTLRIGRRNMADTLKADALIATLDPAFYNDP